MASDESIPHHDLPTVQQNTSWRRWTVTLKATAEIQQLGFDEDDIMDCVLALTSECFGKSMPDTQRPGSFLDVYKPMYLGRRLYVKFGMIDNWVTIISFKGDTSR